MPHLSFPTFFAPSAVHPSLQAAAGAMTGPQFCAFTEQVRDSLLAGDTSRLNWIMTGQKIKATRKSLSHIVMARFLFLNEFPSQKLLEAIVDFREATPTVRKTKADQLPQTPLETALWSLNHKRLGGRKDAAEELGRIGDSTSIAALAHSVAKDPSPSVRKSAVTALTKIGSPAVQTLLTFLKTGSSEIKVYAMIALGSIRDELAIPALGEVLNSDDPLRVRRAAASVLTQFGMASFEALRKGLERRRESYVVDAFVKLGDPKIVRPLLTMVPASSISWRHQSSIVDGLIDALKDSSWRIRGKAADCLISCDLTDRNIKRVIEALTERLQDDSDYVRRMAARSLESIQSRLKEAPPASR